MINTLFAPWSTHLNSLLPSTTKEKEKNCNCIGFYIVKQCKVKINSFSAYFFLAIMKPDDCFIKNSKCGYISIFKVLQNLHWVWISTKELDDAIKTVFCSAEKKAWVLQVTPQFWHNSKITINMQTLIMHKKEVIKNEMGEAPNKCKIFPAISLKNWKEF